MKTPTYKAEKQTINNAFLTSLKEQHCKIKGYHQKHWIFKDFLNQTFLIHKLSQWEIHEFSTGKNEGIKILAETK